MLITALQVPTALAVSAIRQAVRQQLLQQPHHQYPLLLATGLMTVADLTGFVQIATAMTAVVMVITLIMSAPE